jgi:putative MATE family efflux protein
MVRSLGSEAISAVGIARTILFVLGITMIAVATGTMAMVAQAVGAKDLVDASKTAKQSATLVLGISSVISVFGILTSDMALRSLSIPDNVSAIALPYLQVIFASLPLMALDRTLDSCLFAAGDTRTPFYISLVANFVHLIAAYALIYGAWGLPELGVKGAAVGNLVRGVFSNAIRFVVLYSGRFGFTLLPGTSYIPERERARRILRIGIPSALQGLFRNGSNVLYMKLVAMTVNPTVALTAYSIGRQMGHTVRRTSLSFGTTTTSLVGRSLGAKEPETANARGWTTLVLSVGILTVLGFPFILFADGLMGIFTDEVAVIAVGIPYLYAIAIAEPFMCSAIATQGSLRAAGDTISPLIYTIVSQWLIQLPVAYLLAFTLGWDTNGIWLALVIFSAMQGFLTVRKFAQGEWRHRKL